MDMSADFGNAKNVLNCWKDNNAQKLWDYFRKHDWLKADIEKLRHYTREHSLSFVAITDKMVYGEDQYGIIVITGRGNLGIADNYQ